MTTGRSMRIGIGMPNNVIGATGPMLVDWARRAEERGFDSLVTIDRITYPTYDPLISLTAAASVTSRIELSTNILSAPLYQPTLLARSAAALDDISGHRLSLGLALGGYREDYAAAGVDYARRGEIFDRTLTAIRQFWHGDQFICDDSIRRTASIPILVGGSTAPAIRRIVQHDGWAGGATRDYADLGVFADRLRTAWRDAGRTGQPRLRASVNFALGDAATVASGRAHLAAYYELLPDFAPHSVAQQVSDSVDVKEVIQAYGDLGFDELIFHPAVAATDQIDRLADLAL
ncbi:LLM class flavin-dependent oxidoreductase [Nocardia sp. NPDC052566]|uniref:LLM class flavin-dependent oxidoreductase n=1 Tax=Nocardia sp. NPDC052566 TaxID=3364330 RepID=UPI0037CA60BE